MTEPYIRESPVEQVAYQFRLFSIKTYAHFKQVPHCVSEIDSRICIHRFALAHIHCGTHGGTGVHHPGYFQQHGLHCIACSDDMHICTMYQKKYEATFNDIEHCLHGVIIESCAQWSTRQPRLIQSNIKSTTTELIKCSSTLITQISTIPHKLNC